MIASGKKRISRDSQFHQNNVNDQHSLKYSMVKKENKLCCFPRKNSLKAFLKLCTDVFCCKVIGKLFHGLHVVTLEVLPPSNLHLNFRHTKYKF